MDEELSIEELLGFHEEQPKIEEDLFSELEETNLETNQGEDMLSLNVRTGNNTNDLLSAFSDSTMEELLHEMDKPEGKFVHKAIIEDHVANLDDIKAFMEDAKRKRDSN